MIRIDLPRSVASELSPEDKIKLLDRQILAMKEQVELYLLDPSEDGGALAEIVERIELVSGTVDGLVTTIANVSDKIDSFVTKDELASRGYQTEEDVRRIVHEIVGS